MMTKAMNYISLTFLFVIAGLKSAWQYRISFYVAVGAMFVNDIFLLGIWVIFFQRFKTVNGWTFENTQYLFTTLLLSFSMAIIFFSGVLRIAERISQGKVDTYLTQPKSVLFRMLTDDFQLSTFGDLLFGIVMLFVVSYKFGYENLFYIPVASFFYAWGIVATAGSFALFGFWLKKFDSAAYTFFWTLDTPSMYPQNTLIGGMRILFFTVVPSLWYIGFSYKFVKYHSFTMLLIVIAYDIVMTLFMIALCRSGLKKYESGNAIATND